MDSLTFRLLVRDPFKKLAHAHNYGPWKRYLHLKHKLGIADYCVFVRARLRARRLRNVNSEGTLRTLSHQSTCAKF